MYDNPMAQKTNVAQNLGKKEKNKRLRMMQDYKESCQITIGQFEQ